MIGIPLAAGLALKSAGKWIVENLHWILLGALVVTVLLFAYAKGRNHERDRWKPQVELLNLKIETMTRDAERATEQANRLREEEQRRVAELQRTTEETYAARLASTSARADALLSELRRARAADRVRPLAPSSAAPAPCRDYAADRTRLPDEDVEFLVGEARAAAACVDRYAACRTYALGLHENCTAPPEKKAD